MLYGAGRWRCAMPHVNPRTVVAGGNPARPVLKPRNRVVETRRGRRDGGWICFGWIWDYGIFYAMGIIKTSIVNSPLPL